MRAKGKPRHPGRHGAAWNRARKEVLEWATVCHICGGPLDFEAPPRSRWSPSADHLVPIKFTRQMDAEAQRVYALDPAYLRPAHYGCNSARGTRSAKAPRRRSEAW